MMCPLDARPSKNGPLVETVTNRQRRDAEIKLAECVLYRGRNNPMLTQATLVLQPYSACTLATTLSCDTQEGRNAVPMMALLGSLRRIQHAQRNQCCDCCLSHKYSSVAQ
jgi:hypothetical protein